MSLVCHPAGSTAVPDVAFVCTGNLCRSPMAEGILRDRWEKLGRSDLTVSSMGIHAVVGEPASEFARQACAEHGIDISAHRAREIVIDELDAAQIVLAMDRLQKDFIDLFFPRLAHKVFLLAVWPEEGTRKSDVADPMGGGLRQFRRAYDTIAGHIDRILPALTEYCG
jgi:protein-tyrosine-phosphatase